MFGDLLSVTYPGPPPRRPIEPQYVQTTHVLHLLLTLITCGLWALVWFLVAVSQSTQNQRARFAYEQAMAQWEHDMWVWEEARRGGYGQPPPGGAAWPMGPDSGPSGPFSSH